jgi:hypothetical protein
MKKKLSGKDRKGKDREECKQREINTERSMGKEEKYISGKEERESA